MKKGEAKETRRRHARLGAAIPDEMLGIWARYTDEYVSAELRADIEAELEMRGAR